MLIGVEADELVTFLNETYSDLCTNNSSFIRWKKVSSSPRYNIMIRFHFDPRNKPIHKEALRKVFGDELNYYETNYFYFRDINYLRKLKKNFETLEELGQLIQSLNEHEQMNPYLNIQKRPWYIEKNEIDDEDEDHYCIRFTGKYANPTVNQHLKIIFGKCIKLEKNGFHSITNIEKLKKIINQKPNQIYSYRALPVCV